MCTLSRSVYEPFSEDLYREGYLAPVFFGSAINNFGVKELLETFIRISPAPRSRETDKRTVDPAEDAFSGFIFKIHANSIPTTATELPFAGLFQVDLNATNFTTM
jgi:peptide chain release factor 3